MLVHVGLRTVVMLPRSADVPDPRADHDADGDDARVVHVQRGDGLDRGEGEDDDLEGWDGECEVRFRVTRLRPTGSVTHRSRRS